MQAGDWRMRGGLARTVPGGWALPASLLVCALGCGCGDASSPREQNPAGGTPSTTTTTTIPTWIPPQPLDLGSSTLVAPATNGLLPVAFTLQAEGAAPGLISDLAIRENVGELKLDSARHAAVAYQAHYRFGVYDLYDVLSVAQDGSDLAVSWLYCRPGLEWIWEVSYRHVLAPSAASGICRSTTAGIQTQVRLPPLRALPPPRRSGFKVVGPDINVGEGVGAIRLDGLTYNVHTLATVDCTSCPGGAWYEIHCLFRRQDEAGFGIFYLYPGSPKHVDFTNALTFPTLERKSVVFQATWSGYPVAAVQGWFSLPDEPDVILGRPLPPLYERVR
jgi:hypothetical protein